MEEGEVEVSTPAPVSAGVQPGAQIAFDRLENDINRRLNAEQFARMEILARLVSVEGKANRCVLLEQKVEFLERKVDSHLH